MHLLAARSVAAVGVVSLGAALLPWIGLQDDATKEVRREAVQSVESAVVGAQSPPAPAASEPERAPKLNGPEKGDRSPSATKRSLVRSGRLNLDPNRLARVHARFGGQVIAIGQTEFEPGFAVNQKSRPLQFGDAVKKGQLLAIVWSQEVGEKKSELLHAMSQVFLANRQLAQARSVAKGSEGERQLSEAERHMKAAAIAVERIERTLHSWKISEEEIHEVCIEAQRMQQAQSAGNPQLERTWAEVKVRAAFDGVVLERNISIGEVVDNRLDLFKIGDVSTLGVTIDVYEEDLPALEALGPESRHWVVRLKSEPGMRGIPGSFDVIANVVDPHRHTISVMGTLDNSQGLLRAGQFVTAEICLR